MLHFTVLPHWSSSSSIIVNVHIYVSRLALYYLIWRYDKKLWAQRRLLGIEVKIDLYKVYVHLDILLCKYTFDMYLSKLHRQSRTEKRCGEGIAIPRTGWTKRTKLEEANFDSLRNLRTRFTYCAGLKRLKGTPLTSAYLFDWGQLSRKLL